MHEKPLIASVNELREEAPRIGAYKLYLMLCNLYGREKMMGRDSFFNLLRRYRLMLSPLKSRSTTNSNHRFHKYKNLVKGVVVTGPNQIWVADITYIELEDGVCYLHLITDAYSHKIIGWILAPGLHAVYTLHALEMAIAGAGKTDLSGLIHHSDRGVQYCCDSYVKCLSLHHINISMTQDYKPTDNAIAGVLRRHYNILDLAPIMNVVSATIKEMREGPSQSSCRSRLQTITSCVVGNYRVVNVVCNKSRILVRYA